MKRQKSIIVGAMALILAGQAVAQTPAPFPDFTFKRVKIPGSGQSNRITVQIDPTANVAPADAALSESDKPEQPSVGVYDWYWDGVSPSLAATGPGRLEQAVNYLTLGPEGARVETPRLKDLQAIAAAHGVEILKATIGTNVSPALVLALIGIESSGDTSALSTAGAQGLMQLMPATAARFGVLDPSVPSENIKGGVAYLNWLMNEFDGDPVLILAAYNAGENAVRRHEGVPPFPETRSYVPKVLAAWTVARAMCLTPPQLVTDGCVFISQGVGSNG